MPSGADLEYARMLAAAGVNPASPAGYDGARLEQMGDERFPSGVDIADDINTQGTLIRSALNKSFVNTLNLVGTDIDLTGVVDSTIAVKAIVAAAPANSLITIPAGAVINMTDTLEIDNGKTLSGPGHLKWTAGIANKAALLIRSGCTIIDVTISNPLLIRSNGVGDRSYGMDIRGSDVSIIGCTVDSFENGIIIDPGGYWYNHRIMYNRVKDILGSGEGAANIVSTLGEDRGDGICAWSSSATIVGNIVNCKTGYDARIGIHTEDMTPYAGVLGPHPASLVTITGNVVYGQFRRGIATENTKDCTIVGNTVADSTWWGISISSGNMYNSVVSGNTVKWTRTAADNQGDAWSPIRGPYMIMGGVTGCNLSNNTARLMPGSSAIAAFITYPLGADKPTDCTFSSNVAAIMADAFLDMGFFLDTSSKGIRILNNHISGIVNSNGVYAFGADGVDVINNIFKGNDSGPSQGVRIDAGSGDVKIHGNSITDFNFGFTRFNTTDITSIQNNIFRSCAAVGDLFGNNSAILTGNVYKACGAGVSNLGTNLSANNLTLV